MAKRSKRKVVGSRVSVARKPSAPSYIITMAIRLEKHPQDQAWTKLCTLSVKLPCPLSELAFDVSEIAFSVCEELAFKAGIEFLPAKEIPIGEDGQTTEKIPF